jgi:hypothetical protein
MAGGGMERTGGPLGIPGRTARDARRWWTPRQPRWARGQGKGGLGTRAGPDVEARYGARGRGAGARGAARRLVGLEKFYSAPV